MLDDLSDALARLAFSRLAQDRAHPRTDLDTLPPLLGHTLRQRLVREATARLDVAAPWVSSIPDLWREDALTEVRYPASEWATAVREASAWVLSALVHPAEVLGEIAPESGNRPTEEVLDRMADLGAYPYLAEIVGRYAEKKELEGYDRETLRGLLDRVDRRIAAELDVDGWQALLGPLYDVAGALPEYADGVPGRILAEVFAVRGRPGLGAAVVEREAVSRAALAEIVAEALAPIPEPDEVPEPDSELTEVIPVEPAASSQSVPKETVTDAVEIESVETLSSTAEEPAHAEEDRQFEAPLEAPPIEPTDPEPAREPQDAISDASDEGSTEHVEAEEPLADAAEDLPETSLEANEEPLWARLARERSRTPDPLTPSADAADTHEPLWRRFTPETGSSETGASEAAPESAPEPLPPPPPPSLASAEAAAYLEGRVLGDRADQRDAYVERLFGGNEADYHRVLALLDAAASWSEATEVIGREVFRRYQTPIYSEPAASFTNAVERGFGKA